MFSKILIANRGEIACRVIHTAHRLGIRCVAVYSEADAHARHVAMADEAFLLGPAPAAESYLRADRIIELARQSGAQAIHPGYGFLSENSEFADSCARHGLVFIGPPAAAIAAMGSKSAAKAIMQRAGVPLVPGYHGAEQSPERLRDEAERCGFPLLLKAVAGGGGKGMRVVNHIDEFDDALAAARREAQNAFGNPDMLLERYLHRARHVEIQVFCDQHGNGLYLAERDCSVQRRHQKVLEEAPAPGLSDATRQAMGEAAVRAARAIDYVGAGTVEFLYQGDDDFYFMEMNTRLQVEHPVTEMVTGLDLVEWQLRVADGAPLPLTQQQVRVRGHALEARIYAEDPDHDFLPATGRLHYLRTPAESTHVRVDTGVVEGDEIGIHYDPMIAKLIVWDDSREQAINRLVQALEHYRIGGVKNNVRFLHALADAQPFRQAELDTGFIEQHRPLLFPPARLDHQRALVLSAGFWLETARADNIRAGDPWSPFGCQSGWRLNSEYARPLSLRVGETVHTLTIRSRPPGHEIGIDGSLYYLQARLQDDRLSAVVDGHTLDVHGWQQEHQLTLFYEGESFSCSRHEESFEVQHGDLEGSLLAPMNGVMVAVLVKKGEAVCAGQPLLVMEAMKMEHIIKAPRDGMVGDIYYREGEQVAEGSELVVLESITEEGSR
ncbi:acetyl/propionyl/methylcrotonyl-CoA carboxylase subunit alpha [Zobellella maritima]|uniref:acetyl/propionyl/methylcrotonyl-CoA carboxylase subunit alpha n=1 Tax=Zobellella maritima TaxID=2059725 RepID=UPI000E300613|nr:acetyl/propionyl/methylcrotonyl-CoA carboxylase subunit alpha [Zobellella maritima]